MKRNYRLTSVITFVLAFAVMSMSGCVLATVRTLEEDEEAKVGFDPNAYVDGIWESQVLPTYEEKAVPLGELVTELRTNEVAAIDKYGSRSGTGAFSFMVRGEGVVLSVDTSSRSGLALVDLVPGDGTADFSMAIGPLIKVSQRAAVRDAVGFIAYGNFVNQQEFAGVANAMGERILAMIAEQLGVDDIEAIPEQAPAVLEGKTISFIGAFALDDLNNIILVPVSLEVNN